VGLAGIYRGRNGCEVLSERLATLVTHRSRGKIEVRSPTDMRYSETKDVIVKEQEGTCVAGDYIVGSYYKGADTSQEK